MQILEFTMEKPLNQQVVFITGAASGIGLACAYRFAQEGAAVMGFDISEGGQWQQVSDITDKQHKKSSPKSLGGTHRSESWFQNHLEC